MSDGIMNGDCGSGSSYRGKLEYILEYLTCQRFQYIRIFWYINRILILEILMSEFLKFC